MTDWTRADVESFAARIGLTWLTPDLTDLLQAGMNKAASDGAAVPRQPTEFTEPAHVFAGPGARRS